MSNVDMEDGGFDGLLSSEESPLSKDAEDAPKASATRIDSILRIPVVLQVVVGSATLPVSNLLKLGRGAVVPLDHRVGDPVDVVVNGRTIARGEVVVVEEDGARFGVSLTEICEPQSEQSR
ncbi:flagellar motor switch protein FliN [Methylocystis echinoides]|jgi:flagellar motor switch protein FliN/FliY|uniref:Flagellar motor switch protein FliN n=1 Tax=Methylocystis echinoides TaxID=29468 RepID=A0A9W6LR29_9HYPH|nr:flagellar motor switch protein FliN [Methylocystis echinoides]GLI92108.1 flagellar motor switch protein FliN [Methylocystis echinoides]